MDDARWVKAVCRTLVEKEVLEDLERSKEREVEEKN